MRVQKYLAAQTGLSRRHIEQAIAQGAVRVNHQTISLGAQVTPGDLIHWQGRRFIVTSNASQTPEVLLYHKPLGVLSARRDNSQRPCVYDHLPPCPQGRWINVGRLDINTSGLLLLTNDGDLANQLMHPKQQLTRIYQCRVFPAVNTQALQSLLAGKIIEGKLCQFKSIKPMAQTESRNRWYQVSVVTGQYRMVRRMWASVGAQVSKLIRTHYGPASLPLSLKEGHCQKASSSLVKQLLGAAGG